MFDIVDLIDYRDTLKTLRWETELTTEQKAGVVANSLIMRFKWTKDMIEDPQMFEVGKQIIYRDREEAGMYRTSPVGVITEMGLIAERSAKFLYKYGAVLSTQDRELLKTIHDQITELLSPLKELIDNTEPAPEEEELPQYNTEPIEDMYGATDQPKVIKPKVSTKVLSKDELEKLVTEVKEPAKMLSTDELEKLVNEIET